MLSGQYLLVNTNDQTLKIMFRQQTVVCYSVSTAKNGVGQLIDSEKTPLGRHKVRAKIGAGQPIGSIFVGRRTTGEIITPQLIAAYPQRDWILTRILWLSGIEVGYNRLGQVDTMQRFIYIHGTSDLTHLGQPASKGCVRMACQDLVELYDQVAVGCLVVIE